jgi:hypothetical protein
MWPRGPGFFLPFGDGDSSSLSPSQPSFLQPEGVREPLVRSVAKEVILASINSTKRGMQVSTTPETVAWTNSVEFKVNRSMTVRWIMLSKDLGICNGRPEVGGCRFNDVEREGGVGESRSKSMVLDLFALGGSRDDLGVTEMGIALRIFVTGVLKGRWPGMGIWGVITISRSRGVEVTEVGTILGIFVMGVHGGKWSSWPGVRV